jgi:hypothetical protein
VRDGAKPWGYMVLAALAFYPELWRCGVEAVGIANLETSLRNTAVSGGSIAWLKVYVFELYAALNISEALRFERTVGGAAPNQAYQNSECRNKQATQISDYDAATARISAVRASLVLRENRFPLSMSPCSTSPATASKPPRTSCRWDSSRRPVNLLGSLSLDAAP